MKTKHVPLRMCTGCGEMKPKKELVRIVHTKEGEIKVDLTGKLSGRGAYLCHSKACLAKAIKAKSKTPEGKLLPFVLSNLQMTGPRRDAIRVSNRLTVDALKAAGYAEAEYKLETILKDFEIEE